MKKKIKLNNAMEVSEFVSIANKCDFDIDVQYHHFMFDGKSLVALMSLDLSYILTIYANGTNPVFEALLEKYSISR